MNVPAQKKATYDDLYGLPENMNGEIIDGELIASPRPSRRHGYTSASLTAKVIPEYQFREGGGPGGWVIMDEPEISFGDNIIVPDIAGWKRERFPVEEDHNWISVVPDWVCEIVSPRSASIDRIRKMGLYAAHGVPYYWIIDPISKTLEVYENENSRWLVIGLFAGNDTVRVLPFHESEIDLSSLWLESVFTNSLP